jgi:LysR family transcriptional regulator, nitrogen assimilation regulatory protein
MELRRLSYFVRVAEDGSLTKAAAKLRVAQSALSRQMRLLEDELGVALFDRTARGMRPTNAGEHLRTSVAGPLRELELALQNIRTMPSAVEATLVLGMPPGLADVLAQTCAIDLHAVFPGIRFSLVEAPTGSLVDWLTRGMIDFALLEETARNHRLREQCLLSLPLVLAGHKESTVPAGRVLTMTDVLRLPLILPSHHLGIRAAVNDAAIRAQATVTTAFEADSARLIKDLVQSGIGYSILPGPYFAAEVQEAALRKWTIDEPGLAIDIFLCSRKGSQNSGKQFRAVEERILRIAKTELELLSKPR